MTTQEKVNNLVKVSDTNTLVNKFTEIFKDYFIDHFITLLSPFYQPPINYYN